MRASRTWLEELTCIEFVPGLDYLRLKPNLRCFQVLHLKFVIDNLEAAYVHPTIASAAQWLDVLMFGYFLLWE